MYRALTWALLAAAVGIVAGTAATFAPLGAGPAVLAASFAGAAVSVALAQLLDTGDPE